MVSSRDSDFCPGSTGCIREIDGHDAVVLSCICPAVGVSPQFACWSSFLFIAVSPFKELSLLRLNKLGSINI